MNEWKEGSGGRGPVVQSLGPEGSMDVIRLKNGLITARLDDD